MVFDTQKIKAIVCDMDGTILFPGATLGENTVSVLKKCIKQGLHIILATGRSVFAAEKYRAEIGAEGPMIYYNGAEIVDMPKGTILYSSLLPPEAAIFCVNLARERGIHFHVFFIDDKDASTEILVSENPSQAAVAYAERTGLNFKYGNLLNDLSMPNPPLCAKGLFIGSDGALEEIRSALREEFGDKLTVVKSASTFLEVLNAGTSKGRALEALFKIRGLESDNILAFGDEENDIAMLKIAGFSAAPANATEAVKKIAKTVIGANTEEGVAAFLEENFLKDTL
ncbi:MAG: Cof-type HAD-IIB family hydrolase [Spirochaetaceae bacterium]|jgi:Cof subfamily protein (haloacid dehalogenase superfamily)|nr:Cof-type HAD-IIB family hydrolase [Spirochaetaceae bacterium]